MPDAAASPELDTRCEFNCPTCALSVPGGLVYCPRCRAVAEGRSYDEREVDQHERHYLFSLVALSLGALAIPRLLRSQVFTPAERAGLVTLGVLNTGGVVVICLWFARWFPAYVASLAGR